MANEHLVVEDAGLSLPAVHDHRLFVDCGCVVLSCARAEPGRFALSHTALVRIELKQLVGALAHLALRVEHEAAAEDVNFAIKSACCMTLATLHRLRARIRNSLPNDRTSVYFSGYYILACVEIETANHEHGVSN